MYNQETQATIGTRHKAKTNKTKNTTQKAKKTINYKPTKKKKKHGDEPKGLQKVKLDVCIFFLWYNILYEVVR